MTENSRARAEWVALSSVPRVGGKVMGRLLDQFGSAGAVLGADRDALMTVSGVGPKVAAQIQAADVDAIQDKLAAWQTAGIRALAWDEDGYPTLLRGLDDRPPTLFMRGTWPTAINDGIRTVAVVGTRQPTPETATCAHQLAEQLAVAGWTVVSGLALGIDSQAHTGALAVPDGQTVAVLGSGVLYVYPPPSRGLVPQILARGALVGEVLPDATPNGPQLVARNRIISGLSRALIVVQAGADSGALHAARFARQQGRRLCVVDFEAAGNVRLRDEGAVVLRRDLANLDDLLASL